MCFRHQGRTERDPHRSHSRLSTNPSVNRSIGGQPDVCKNPPSYEVWVVNCTVPFKLYSCRQPFVVVRKLTSDIILGIKFIINHLYTILIRQWRLIFTDGTKVTIERRSATRTRQNSNSTPTYFFKLALLTPQIRTVFMPKIKIPGSYII